MKIKSPTSVICPVLSAGRPNYRVKCIGADCAWWHAYNISEKARPGCCALVSIAEYMADMNVLDIDRHND